MQRIRVWFLSRRRRRIQLPQVAVSRGGRLMLWLCLFLSAAVCLYIWTDTKIRPVVQQLANARVHNLASVAANNAINDVLARQSVQYNDLISLEKDINGEIRALQTNMAKINTLKTEVCTEVLHRVDTINRSDLSIAIGSITNSKLLAGRGPRISVRLVPVGAVDARFENVFSAAGINQTRHQIIMYITVNMSVLTMAQSVDMSVSSQMVIAETIIVGDVPNTYASFGG